MTGHTPPHATQFFPPSRSAQPFLDTSQASNMVLQVAKTRAICKSHLSKQQLFPSFNKMLEATGTPKGTEAAIF